MLRVRRGLYLPVPLGVTSPSGWTGDPWVIMTRTFSPCYIGGFSTCEHWGLTEQIFRVVFVFTRKRVRPARGEIRGIPYIVKTLSPGRFFGTRRIWRDRTPVAVSDPSRTLVDLLDDPSTGGGMRHVAIVVAAYFQSEHRNYQQLIDYTLRLGNRTVFKRLGYLVERLGIDAPVLVAGCLANLSTGYSVLDPAGPRRGRLLRRWRLLVNVGILRP